MSNYVTNSHYLDIIDNIAEQMNQYSSIFTAVIEYFEKNDYTVDAVVELMKKFKDDGNQIGYATANQIYMLSTNQRVALADSVKRNLVYKK